MLKKWRKDSKALRPKRSQGLVVFELLREAQAWMNAQQ